MVNSVGSVPGPGPGYGFGFGYGSGYSDDGYAVLLPTLAGDYQPPDGGVLAYWRSARDGFPANGGRSRIAAQPGLIQEVRGPLELCTNHALHGTHLVGKWRGGRCWVVCLYPPVEGNAKKFGSLKREIVCEVKGDWWR